MTTAKSNAADRAEEARQYTAITQSRHLVVSAERARKAQMNNAADRYLRNVLTMLEGIDSEAAVELRTKAEQGLAESAQ